MAEHLYSLEDTKGNYAEISFDGEKWTERWNNSFLPKFVYDMAEIGNLIQEHFDL